MKMPKKIAALLTVTLVAGSVSANIASADTKNESLVGAGRWETAIKVSQNGWSSSKEAVIVNENSIPDALSATPFADAKNAPILLTQKNKLDDRTKAELKRLGVNKVYLIGGESVINKDVEAALKAQGITVERIWGSERYETSLEIAKRLDKIKDVSEIAVVNGDKGLADAVSIGAPAAQKDMPIILSDPTKGTSVSDEFIKNAGIKTSYVIGGETVVSKEVASKLPNVKRLGGIDRNETNAKVVSEFYKGTDLKNAYVAKDGMKNKDQLIDALAVGVLAAKNQSPVVLVSNKLSAPQKEVLNTKSLDKVTQVGGNGNEAAFNELKTLQAKTTHTAKTVAELKSAVAKADANDVVNFNPGGTVSEDITIATKNAISVNLSGTYKGKVTINMPNGDVTNNGTMDKVIVDDIKVGTFTNNGKITNLTVNDNNGGKIVNGKDGKIEEIKVPSGAKAIAIENKGTVSTIKNDSKDTVLNNEGKVDKVEGNEKPSTEGNRPGGGSGGGGSSSGGGSTTPSTTANISTEVAFKEAIKDINIKTINITKSIENISETIKVTRKVTINGEGKTLSFTEKVSSKQNTNGKRNGLLIQSDDVVINNLKVEMTQIDDWTGAYGVQVYDSERVVLNNYTGKNGDAALLVNGSKVELTGTTTVSDNEFGGIEVSKGTEAGLKDAELKIRGVVVNSTEAYGKPAIWLVNEQGNIIGENIFKVVNKGIDAKQTQYYLYENSLKTANVSKIDKLTEVLDNNKFDTINITKDIPNIPKTIKVNRKVTINGYDKTLSFTGDVSKKDNEDGERNGILIQENGVVINNLKVEMTQIGGWTGAYGVQVYDSEGVVLNNYTGKNGDAALLVNGSKVELTGTTIVSDNEFGGIEVSKGTETDLKNAELKVTETLENDTEKRTEPTIWSIVDKGTVNWNGKVGHGEVEDKKLYYYIDDNKANGDTYIKAEKELTLDQDGSYKADFKWSSIEGIGNKLVETKELAQGRYAYYSDGAYLRFKVKHDDTIKNFSEVFQDMTLTTNKHEVGHKVDSIKGKNEGRQYEDWTGDKGTSYTSLQIKDDKYVFYGVRQGNLEGKKVTRTVGFGENEIRTIDMRLIPESELESGTYTVTVEVLQQDGENFGTIDYTFEVQDTGSSI